MKIYDHILSLGLNCEVSFQMRVNEMPIESGLFSWVAIIRYDRLLNVLANPDLVFSEGHKHLPGVNMTKCSYSGMAFHGHMRAKKMYDGRGKIIRELADGEIADTIGRTRHLSKKFVEIARNGESKLYILSLQDHYCPLKGVELRDFIKSVKAALDLYARNYDLLCVATRAQLDAEMAASLQDSGIDCRCLERYAPFNDVMNKKLADLKSWQAIYSNVQTRFKPGTEKVYKWEEKEGQPDSSGSRGILSSPQDSVE